jgi:trimeric autotransporter adhesin
MKHTTLLKAFCASSLIAMSVTSNAQGIISTIAGTGSAGFSGDGGAAVSAQLSNPSGVSADGYGNIFIADKNNHRVRMISTMGFISTVAGNGTMGYSGMGGDALLAKMEYPNAVFVDHGDNILVTDFFADCAYRIDGLSGIISNFMGHNSQGDDGDEGDGPLARMELPHGVWKDAAGNTFFADYGNNKIRKVDAGTNIAHTITGGHSMFGFSPSGTPANLAKFNGINGVCVDNAGNIYISDLGNHVVRKIDASGRVRTVAGTGVAGYSGDGGSALSATLRNPSGLFVNDAGFLFICDEGANVVRVVNINSGTINTLAGTGTAGFSGDGGDANHAQLNQPSAVWQDATGVFYIADQGNQRIRMIADAGYRSIKSNGVSNINANSLNVFPNPTTGTFTVETATIPQNGSVEVYNVLGAKVYSQNITARQTTISLDQPNGVYSILVKSNLGSTAQKIVIAK